MAKVALAANCTEHKMDCLVIWNCDYECAFAAKLTRQIFIADFELFPLSLRRNTWEDKVPTID